MDKTIKQGIDEVSFSAKLSHKGKKAKWYLRNNVSILKNSCETFFFYSGQMPFFSKYSPYFYPALQYPAICTMYSEERL